MKETIFRVGEQVRVEFQDERFVGTAKGKSLVVNRSHRDILKKLNAYGVNAAAIDSGEFDAIVVVEEAGKNLFITVTELKNHGHLSREGDYELQYFVPIKNFTLL